MQISKEVIQKMYAMQNDLNLFSAYFHQFSLTLSSTVVFHSWLWISKTNFSAHYSRYKLRNLKCISDFKRWHGKVVLRRQILKRVVLLLKQYTKSVKDATFHCIKQYRNLPLKGFYMSCYTMWYEIVLSHMCQNATVKNDDYKCNKFWL